MANHTTQLSNNLLSILSDNSDDVVLKCISVLAEIVNSQHSKGKFEVYLYNLISNSNIILQKQQISIKRIIVNFY